MHSPSTLKMNQIIGVSSIMILASCSYQQHPVLCRNWTMEQRAAIYERTRVPGPDALKAMDIDDPMRNVDRDYIRICRLLK
jgi:hypothetical protein